VRLLFPDSKSLREAKEESTFSSYWCPTW